MSTPGERIRDALKALGEAFVADVGEGNVATDAQQLQLKADVWDAVRAECIPRTAAFSQDGTQSTTAGNAWVEFNLGGGRLVDDGLVELSSGVGQAQGIIKLKAGTAFRVHCFVRAEVVNSGHRVMNFRKVDGTDLGSGETRTGNRPPFMSTYDNDLSDIRAMKGNATGFETVQLAADLEVVLEFVSGFGSLSEAWVFIEEVRA